MLDLVARLNAEIHSVSDDEHYVTLLLAEVDTHKRTLRYVNCGHNPAFLFQAEAGTLKPDALVLPTHRSIS
jgi:serine phosphatase RsbU (regulator of sigma subunit)